MERLLGVFLVLGSAVCFGVNPLFARVAYADGVTPISFLFIRFSLAALILLAVMMLKKIPFPRGRLLVNLILLGIWGMAGSAVCYYSALNMISTSLVVVLIYTYPAMVTALGAIAFKKRPDLPSLMALILTLSGIVLTAGPLGGGQAAGVVLALSGALIFAIYLLFGSLAIRQAGYFAASAVITSAATAVYGLGALTFGMTWPAGALSWTAIVVSALLSTFLGGLAFCAGLERIESSSAAMLSTVEVVVAVGMAMLFLGETMTWTMSIGGAMILGAAIMLARLEMRAVRAVPVAVILDQEKILTEDGNATCVLSAPQTASPGPKHGESAA